MLYFHFYNLFKQSVLPLYSFGYDGITNKQYLKFTHCINVSSHNDIISFYENVC